MNFEQLRARATAKLVQLEESELPRVYIDTTTFGRDAGSIEVLQQFQAEFTRAKIAVNLIEVGCLGNQNLQPLVLIGKPDRPRIAYYKVTPETVSQLVTEYIINDQPRPDLALGTIGSGGMEGIPKLFELPWFQQQLRIATRNCGIIDPTDIDHYLANDGYTGLVNVLSMTPEQAIEEIKKSGLTGRAGIFTSDKWSSLNQVAGPKCLICHAAENDPEAYAVPMMLESDPHAVIEGVLIAGYAVGADQGYIYLDIEKQGLAADRLRNALAQLAEYGLCGENILGSGFKFHLQIYAKANDFNTCLHPETSGPKTCVNSSETMAKVSAIFQKGAAWYAGLGTGQCTGSKLLTLTGKVASPGAVEVPIGTPLRQVVYEIGGGVAGSQDLKAVLIGGPNGGFLPADLSDLPLDVELLAAEGATFGSGNITVADSDTCMVSWAKDCLTFTKAESCGRCVFCREGTAQLLTILTEITEGKGNSEDLDLLLELTRGMQSASLCSFGLTASNPVLTILKHFPEELEIHIKKKRCPALVCKKFITYHILGHKCQGCRLCMERCPSDAIVGGEQMIHVIDQEECTKCGICLQVCPAEFGAVTKAGGVKPKTPEEPIPVGQWKKR